jgi:hypothetical protein
MQPREPVNARWYCVVGEVRTMKLEVPPLQLAEWLIHGIAVIIALHAG